MPGFTKKQDRQAGHIMDSEMAKGMPAEKAKSVGFATVNKMKGKKKKGKKKAKKAYTPEQQNVAKKMGVALK